MAKWRTDKFLSLDLELTCWDGPVPDGMMPEIIEIGIAEGDVASGSVTRSDSFLVRPVRSSISGFCEALTGISAARMRSEGRPLGEVLATLARRYGPASKAVVAWGDDVEEIARRCLAEGIETPFRGPVVDLGAFCTLALGTEKRLGLLPAMALAGLEFEGRHHSGRDDAVNTAKLFLEISSRLKATLSPALPVPGAH
jgi:inhibitor of KinA sporulation pathway (predicted exonuclease)